MIFHVGDARLTRTIGAAIKALIRLDAMPDDLALAVATDRRQLVNRAFKAVERVARARHNDFKRSVVIVAAYFALCHRSSPFMFPLPLCHYARIPGTAVSCVSDFRQ